MQAISHVFSSLLTRYRQQTTDLDAADNQDDIDQLVSASQDTLSELLRSRPRDAACLADKIDALIERYADFGSVPLDHVRQLLLDAHSLATEPGMTLAWVRLWRDLGCTLMVHPDGSRHFGLPDPLRIGSRYTGQLPPHMRLSGEAEANGAAKALQALVRLAGKRAVNAVFAFTEMAGAGACFEGSPASTLSEGGNHFEDLLDEYQGVHRSCEGTGLDEDDPVVLARYGRLSDIERTFVQDASRSAADARAKLQFIILAGALGIELDGGDALALVKDAAGFLL